MAQRTDTVAFRRKLEGKTHYGKRRKLLEGNHIRLVVRKSLKNIVAQLVQYADTGDRVLATASSMELTKKYGWKLNGGNLMAAYLVGMLIAQKAKGKAIGTAMLDIGQITSTSGSRLYAVVKGAVVGGLQVPHGKEILPSEERVLGKHVEQYAAKAPSAGGAFAKYRAGSIAPTAVSQHVAEIKQKILNGAAQ